MENFIATSIFILPGVMAYFWLLTLGQTPPVKHSTSEFTGIAALLWLPISGTTLLFLNGWAKVVGNYGYLSVKGAWTIPELKTATADFLYLFLFMLLSALFSFLICSLWVIIGVKVQMKAVNWMRRKIGLANMSTSPSSWEKFFISYDKEIEKEKQLVLHISKIDKPEVFVVGSPSNVSRVNETDRGLILEKVDEWTEAIQYFEFKTKRAFLDVKSGLLVKELDPENPALKDDPKSKIII